MDPQFLLQRLTEIGQSLEQSGHALALIGLGSATTVINNHPDNVFGWFIDLGGNTFS